MLPKEFGAQKGAGRILQTIDLYSTLVNYAEKKSINFRNNSNCYVFPNGLMIVCRRLTSTTHPNKLVYPASQTTLGHMCGSGAKLSTKKKL